MISFRYHIVTITAVFLALALGFVLGAAIRPTEQAVKNNVVTLTREINDKRAEIVGLRNQMQQSDETVKNLSSRVVRGALVGRQVVYVDDGTGTPWQGRVRKAMSDATAHDVGTLRLTEKWRDPNAAADLNAVAAASGVKSTGNVGSDLMAALGQQLGTPKGAELVTALAKADLVKTDTKTQGMWPPQGAAVLTLTAGQPTTPQSTALAAFARAAARAIPVLVAAGTPANPGAVGALRNTGGGLPPRLATFDSGSTDPTGAGPVLALTAAIDARGGNFGAAPGLPYLPPI